MAEAGEGEPKRCPCGFWGSPQTNNLCSKCYKECQEQMKEATASTAGEKNATQLLTQYGLLSSDLGSSTSSVEIREPQQPQSQDQQNVGTSEAEVDQMNKEKDESAGNFLPGDLPQQKNRKRCWTCKAKLELAQRALGECKCGYVFCFLHRLPEQHGCVYDHKEGGRQEALKTMVPASRKKFGRSFHRMDSRPEQ